MSEQTSQTPEQDDAARTTGPAPEAPAAEPDAPEGEAKAEGEGEGLPANQVDVEDAGTLRKKVTVTVPRPRVDAKFDEMFGELNKTAQVPGFRVGHAPRRLIEKRFGREIRQDVRNALVGDALGKALDQADFEPLGEPDLDLEAVEVPDEGDLSFSFEVEVAPKFELPDTNGIEVVRPPAEVSDEDVQARVDAMRESMARERPVDGPARPGDVVVADVRIAGEGVDFEVQNLELRVAPGQVHGIPLEDLADALDGKKAGASATIETTVPNAHFEEDWRGKNVRIRLDVQDVKRLDLPEADDAFAKQAGLTSMEELRDAVRRRLAQQAQADQRAAMRDQVIRHLLEQTSLEVPEQAAKRYADRLLARRAVELMLRGVPRGDIEQNMAQLEAEARARAAEQLKISFVLGKLADAQGVRVEEGEINARIAEIARRQNRRPERVRHEMRDEGTLETLTTAIREEKALEKVLDSARVVEPAPEAPETGAEKKPPAKKKTKRTKKAGKSTGTTKVKKAAGGKPAAKKK